MMSNSSKEKRDSTLALPEDSTLPSGWRLKMVKRLKGERRDYYLFSPSGKRFRSRPQLKEYLNLTHHQLGLTMDNFPHIFNQRNLKYKTQSNHTPKNNSRAPIQNVGKNVAPQKILKIIEGQQKILPQPPSPPIQLQPAPLVITLQPQQVIIQMVGNQNITTADNKNIAKNTALQTLLPDSSTTKNKYQVNIMSDERKLTELEELDLYYDFDYVSPDRNEYDRPPSRSLFEDENIIEI